MTDDPKNLKDFLGSEDEQKPKTLEEVLKLDDDDKVGSEKAETKKKAKTRNKLIIAIIAVLVIIVGLIFINPWTGIMFSGGDEPTKLKAAHASPDKTEAKVPFYEESEEIKPPVAIPEWAKSPAENDASILDASRVKDAQKALADTRLLALVNTGLKQEELGFTSDINKMQSKTGGLNMRFAYVTTEQFLKESNDITTRLLNPTYGSWEEFQYPQSKAKANFNPKLFSAITSDAYQKKNFGKTDKSYLPVYADWNSNNYGVKNLVPRGVRWIGQITDADTTFKYDKKNINYEYFVTYKVKFTAWSTTHTKLTKNGVLKIKYITDRAAAGDKSLFRIKIDAATLKVK